jgi:Cu(I)/Ag(I) efflux system protein CusF
METLEMKLSILLASISLALALSACGQADQPSSNAVAQNGGTANTSEVYSGTGKVTAIDSGRVTIAHGPIEGIGWPAMTMTFTAPNGLAERVTVGSEVAFSFRQDGSAYVLTALKRRA